MAWTDRIDRDHAGERGEAAQQHGVGNGAPGVLECQLGGGHGQQSSVTMGSDEVRETEVIEAPRRVDEQVPAGTQSS